jgi:hypothetical protein
VTVAQVKALAILVALVALAAIATPGASAGTYEVQVCSQIGGGDGLTFSEGENALGFEPESTCGNPGRFGGSLSVRADSQTNTRGGALWTLSSPTETAIKSVEATRLTVSSWTPRTLLWEVKNGRGTGLDSVAAPSVETGVKYAVNATSMTIGMRCTRNVCTTGDSPPRVSLNGIVATMEENKRPEVSVLATPELAGPVRGTVAIPFKATDKGAGVRLSALFVDGQLTASAEDTNGGKCVVPFRFLVPCDLELEASFALDTTRLKNGPHLIHVEVGDASGIPATSENVLVTVDNTPPPVDPPDPPTPPVVPPVAPPVSPTLAPPMKLPPALSGVSLSRKSIAAGRGKADLRFTSSEAGRLTVAISPMTSFAARGETKALATVSRSVGAGPGALRVAAKAKGKALRPGAYRLTATLRTADGRASAPATLRFKVLPR